MTKPKPILLLILLYAGCCYFISLQQRADYERLGRELQIVAELETLAEQERTWLSLKVEREQFVAARLTQLAAVPPAKRGSADFRLQFTIPIPRGRGEWPEPHITFSPDDRYLAVVYTQVRVFETATGKCLLQVPAGPAGKTDLTYPVRAGFTPDSSTLFIQFGRPADYPGQESKAVVKFYAIPSGEKRLELAGAIAAVSRTSFLPAVSPDGSRFLVYPEPKQPDLVTVWNLKTFKPVGSLQPSRHDGISVLAFSPGSATIAALDVEPTIVLWDAATFKEIRTVPVVPPPKRNGRHDFSFPYFLQFTPDERWLLTACNGAPAAADIPYDRYCQNKVWVIDLLSSQVMRSFEHLGPLTNLRLLPDRQLAIVTQMVLQDPSHIYSWRNQLRLYDLSTGAELDTPSFLPKPNAWWAISDGGMTLATAGYSESFQLREVLTGHDLHATFDPPANPILPLTYSSGGRFLVTWLEEGLGVWRNVGFAARAKPHEGGKQE